MNPFLRPLQEPSFSKLSIENAFRALTEEFSDHAAKAGIAITPHRPETWIQFRELDFMKQLKSYEEFSSFYQNCIGGIAEGLELRQGIQLLKRMLSQSGLHACQDVWRKLDDRDVIEVYTRDFTQLFRNMRFLEVCSYPLAELYINEWVSLYRRPQMITDQLVSSILTMMDATPPATVSTSVPDHILEEVFSLDRRKFFIQQKVFSPLSDASGQVVAFIGSLSATVIGDGRLTSKFPLNISPLSR